ncbi:MAG TPA: PIN domain-containing protein [Geobacteraceae bacterium]
MKLFLDANVLFTAAYSPDGRARALFDLADAGHCSLCASAFALEEARRNLALKAPAKLSGLEHILPTLAIVPEPSPDKVTRAQALPLPLKDAPIMAAAVACAADILVTGDRRDFGPLFGQSTEGVRVMSPREALEEVLKGIS